AGVSGAAVSFALNDRPGVADTTRARILVAANELGWRPNARARALSHRRAFALGLVMSRPPELLAADPFFAHFLAGVESALAARGYAFLLQVAGSDPDAEAGCYRRLAQEGHVDGVLLTDLRAEDDRFELLKNLGLPAVAVGLPHGDCPFPFVSHDDRPGIRAVVEHLVSLGHQKVAYVDGLPGFVHTASRRESWRSALEFAGLEPGPIVAGDFTGPGGATATTTLLEATERPTAIVYANDLMAIAGMGIALEGGFNVPADLSVTGFDDVALAAHVVPALTTVRQNALEWGRISAETLLAAVEERSSPNVQLDLPALVVRASTGPPP
nr:LacI family DNA-binding transcriptional regulator [Actinomycetota bacterium]